MADKRNPYFNNSGCPDPTAYEALKPIITAENDLDKKVHFLIKIVKFILNESGFELISRIEIKDKKSIMRNSFVSSFRFRLNKKCNR